MTNMIVGFSRPKKWKPFSWLIQVGYGIPYSHVFVKFKSNTYDRNLIYQASGTSVNFVGDAYFQDHADTLHEFSLKLSDETQIKVIQFAIDNAGKPYGILNAFGLAIVRVCEFFGKSIDNPFADDGKTYVCCELVSEILTEYFGMSFKEKQDSINPKQLFDYLVEISQKQGLY